jgi:hypothetical protein
MHLHQSISLHAKSKIFTFILIIFRLLTKFKKEYFLEIETNSIDRDLIENT